MEKKVVCRLVVNCKKEDEILFDYEDVKRPCIVANTFFQRYHTHTPKVKVVMNDGKFIITVRFQFARSVNPKHLERFIQYFERTVDLGILGDVITD